MVSPADLEKVEFSVAFRGYNGDQVDDYIDMVVKEFTELTNEYEKYKVLCEKQNEQIKIMRERILELENTSVLPTEPFAPVATAPEVAVKTVVKTVVDTKANKEALEKAGALEKLTTEFKVKALELYKAHLSELEALSFDYDPADFTVDAEISETIEESVITETEDEVSEKNDTTKNDTTEAVEELKEETESPIVTEETTDEETVEESVTSEVSDIGDEDDILSADEIDALCEGSNEDLNSIIDELSGMFNQDNTKAEDVAPEKTQPATATAASKLVQHSFDSLFITSLDDSE